MLKVDKEVLWEGRDNQMASKHKKDFENIVISLQSFLGNQTSIGRNCMCNENMESPHCNQVDDVGLTEKESKSHIVTKIKVPEMIVCFDDGDSQVVKDICIDEGLHPLEKIFSDNNNVSEKVYSALKSHARHANDDPGKDMVDGTAVNTEDFQKDNDRHKSWSSSGAEEKSTTVDESNTELPGMGTSLHKLLPFVETKSDSQHTDLENGAKDAQEAVSSSIPTWISFYDDSDDAHTAPSKEEVYTGTTKAFDTTNSNPANGEKGNPVNLMTGDHSIRALLQSELEVSGQNFSIHENHATDELKNGRVSEPFTTRSSDGSITDIDTEPFLKSHNPFLSTEASSDATTVSMESQEDINFSALSYSSGPKVSSAHISYSGNISHRSDSTTSIRSFAFPVLQSEWNASPVRMTKADRRHSKKNQCWGIGFCCKF